MDKQFPKYDEQILDRVNYSSRAALVLHLIERWGMVAAKDDGEDSAGRSRMTLSPVKEVVDRAIEMADYALAKLNESGDIKDLGDLAQRRFLIHSYDGYRIAPVSEKSLMEEAAARRNQP